MSQNDLNLPHSAWSSYLKVLDISSRTALASAAAATAAESVESGESPVGVPAVLCHHDKKIKDLRGDRARQRKPKSESPIKRAQYRELNTESLIQKAQHCKCELNTERST